MALTLSIHHLPSVPSRELYLLLLSQAGFNTQSAGASAKNLLMSTISHDVTRVRFKAVTDERWVLEPWAEGPSTKFRSSTFTQAQHRPLPVSTSTSGT